MLQIGENPHFPVPAAMGSEAGESLPRYSSKSWGTLVSLVFILGAVGGHRYYLGRFFSAALMSAAGIGGIAAIYVLRPATALLFLVLGTWVYADCIVIMLGRMRDNQGLRVPTSDQQRQIKEGKDVPKSVHCTLCWWILGAAVGAHRHYLGRTFSATLMSGLLPVGAVALFAGPADLALYVFAFIALWCWFDFVLIGRGAMRDGKGRKLFRD